MTHELISIPAEAIERSILIIRRQKVMLDRTLAKLYGESTRVINQVVKRNPTRFPPDFMFQLTMEEALEEKLRGKHETCRLYAFTEHGILMLSSVLKSDRVVLVNIEIMRTFVRLRKKPVSNAELIKRVDALEENYKVFVEAVRKPNRLATPRRKPIGFLANTAGG